MQPHHKLNERSSTYKHAAKVELQSEGRMKLARRFNGGKKQHNNQSPRQGTTEHWERPGKTEP
jgi:hypothetical protein